MYGRTDDDDYNLAHMNFAFGCEGQCAPTDFDMDGKLYMDSGDIAIIEKEYISGAQGAFCQ